jgi:type IX secretion system PorP/SprF family membrane protein
MKQGKYISIIDAQVILIFLVLQFTSLQMNAQMNYFSGSVFDNKLLSNPSQAGKTPYIIINAHVKSPIDNSQPGLAKEYALSADMPISDNAGTGFIILKQSAGLMEINLVSFNYSYGIHFGKSLQLRMGLTGGVKNAKISIANIQGDQNDPVALEYNSHPPSFASSFGMSLYSSKIEFEAVLPNLTINIQNPNLKTIDYEIARGSLGVKFPIGSLESKKSVNITGGIIYYNTTGMLIIGGVRWIAGKNLMFDALYNSTGIITGGIGINLNEKMKVNIHCSMGGLYSQTIYGGTGLAELRINYNIKKSSHE